MEYSLDVPGCQNWQKRHIFSVFEDENVSTAVADNKINIFIYSNHTRYNPQGPENYKDC